jgi:hypothetical protein
MDKVSEMNTALDEYKQGVEQDRMMNAASDAFSVYMAGGGGLKPGSIGSGTGVFGKEGVKQLSNLRQSSGYLSAIKQSMKAGGSQLISGGVSNYAKQKGFGTAYEEYMNRGQS